MQRQDSDNSGSGGNSEEGDQRGSLQASYRREDTRQTFTTMGGVTDDNLYNLMEQIEACVWDNIKLAHINSKLLEYAKNQAIELETARAGIPQATRSTSDLMHEVEELRSKNKQLSELVTSERSKLTDQMRRKEIELQEQMTTLKQETRVNE